MNRTPNTINPLPPRVGGGLPLLGHALEFAKDRGKLFKRGYDSHGRVFSIMLGPKPAAVLIGPELQAQFYRETDKILDMSKPYQFLAPLFGQVTFVADHATYLNQRPVLYEPFQKEKMMRYLTVMDETIRKWVEDLPDSGSFELTEAMQKLVQEVAGRAIMGDRFMQLAGDRFWNLYNIMGKALDPLLPPKLPLPKFIRRDRARKEMMAILRPILQERRSNPMSYDDFLQDFVQTTRADGTPPTDEELLGLIIGLLFAGHETTAGQAAWTLIQLLQHPGYHQQVKAEVDAVFSAHPQPDSRVLVQLTKLRWAVDETTRMRPSADVQIRVTEQDWEVAGHLIPKGWAVFVTGEVSHFLPEVFEQPEQYDPERFEATRCTHKSHKHAIMSFGGGMHKCPGMNFAQNEMMLIAAYLLRHFELELETLDTKVRRDLGANRPTPTIVRFKRRKLMEGQSGLNQTIKSCPFAAAHGLA